MSYWRFFAMILTSTIVMFGLMYLNSYAVEHVFFSETRSYMAVYMGAIMAIIMLAFMLGMYSNRTVNTAIFAGSTLVFAVALFLVRSQTTVGDNSYMRAMIPHHSIAIMTSSRAQLSDPRVQKIAEEIIYAQDKEIAEMRYLVNDISANGDSSQSESSTVPATIVGVEAALSSSEIAILDPEFITPEETAQLFPDGATCRFSYTTDSPAVVAIGQAGGSVAALVKVSGDLVRLDQAAVPVDGSVLTFDTDGMSVKIGAPIDGDAFAADTTSQEEADLVFELDAGLTVGYNGFYDCGA